jgi:hypothetical protein
MDQGGVHAQDESDKSRRVHHEDGDFFCGRPRRLTQKELLLQGAAILDERSDTKLGLKDKAVY